MDEERLDRLRQEVLLQANLLRASRGIGDLMASVDDLVQAAKEEAYDAGIDACPPTQGR